MKPIAAQETVVVAGTWSECQHFSVYNTCAI